MMRRRVIEANDAADDRRCPVTGPNREPPVATPVQVKDASPARQSRGARKTRASASADSVADHGTTFPSIRAGARLGLAVIRGLLLALVATGDRKGARRALRH